MNYYNEWEKYPAEWLRNLINEGLIPPGDVDERSIVDVSGDDLKGYAQCHFFAGIGGWPYALALAGWGADEPVWTGSCPCQPFSVSGKRMGEKDERHLWPDFARLIEECRPPTVFGEQVASSDGRVWLSRVRTDLEVLGYAVGAADLCAAGLGAPHIRQRLWWVGHSEYNGSSTIGESGRAQEKRGMLEPKGSGGGLGDGERNGRGRGIASSERKGPAGVPQDGPDLRDKSGRSVDAGGMGDGDISTGELDARELPSPQAGVGGAGELHGDMYLRSPNAGDSLDPWAGAINIPCLDGKARRVEPGILPLADGVPGRVGQIKAYGNAIVPQVAAEFVSAFMET